MHHAEADSLENKNGRKTTGRRLGKSRILTDTAEKADMEAVEAKKRKASKPANSTIRRLFVK